MPFETLALSASLVIWLTLYAIHLFYDVETTFFDATSTPSVVLVLRVVQADALSANTQMDGDVSHGNGFWSAMHTWRVEWQLPQSDTEQGLGYLRW